LMAFTVSCGRTAQAHALMDADRLARLQPSWRVGDGRR
jgi:hypothetical protein